MAEGEWPPHPTHRHRWIYIVFFFEDVSLIAEASAASIAARCRRRRHCRPANLLNPKRPKYILPTLI